MDDLDELIRQIDLKIEKINDDGSVKSTSIENNSVFAILEKIKNGDEVSYLDMSKINVDDLLLLDSKNVSYLEYACKRKLSFSTQLKKKISSDKNALYICAKNDYLSWLYNFENEDIFFETVDGINTLVDIIFKNNVNVPFFIGKFEKHYEIIDYMIKYNNFNYYQISKKIVQMLFTEQGGNYPIDKYINNKKLVLGIINKVPTDTLVNYCKIKSRFDILVNANEDVLLTNLENGKTVLENLFDNGLSPTFNGYDFTNKKTLEILVQKGRLDLLYNADLNLLFLPFDENKVILI